MSKAKPKNKNSLAKISHQNWLFFKNLQVVSEKREKAVGRPLVRQQSSLAPSILTDVDSLELHVSQSRADTALSSPKDLPG